MRIYSLFFVSALLLPFVALAQTDQVASDQFQQLITVPVQDILVPTVVEVPLPDVRDYKTQFLVVDQDQTVVPSRYSATYQIEPTPITIAVDGELQTNLTDDEPATHDTYPVSGEEAASVTLVVAAVEPLLASSIAIDLARNVSLPATVEVKAVVNGQERVVLATTKMTSSRISFPATEAQDWNITFTHTQPLRISELRFVEDDVAETVAYALRFLAQPDTAYTVYLDPEAHVSFDRIEAGNLASDEEVLVVENASDAQMNQSFVPADTDQDGIPDRIDNCVSVANSDQTDINQNDRGDACDDFDRDGVINSADNCVNQPNQRQSDEDADGIGDACDEEESRVTEKYVWIPWVAMGGALLVFGVLFAIVLRRFKHEHMNTESSPTMQAPVSDTDSSITKSIDESI